MSEARREEIKAEKEYAYDCDSQNAYTVFTNSVDALAAYAALYSQSVKCPAIVFLQGERDYYTDAEGNFHAYAAGADKETYKLYMSRLKEDMQQKVMEAYGQSEKPLFIIYQVSGAYVKKNSEINMAQIEFAQENDDVILVQSPYFTAEYTEGGHLSQNGYRWLGEYIAKYAYAAMVNGEDPSPMLYDSIECIDDTTVRITVSGAVDGLSIDDYTVEDASNGNNLYGFNLIVNGQIVKPSGVTVAGNEIVLTVPDGTNLLSANSIIIQYAGKNAKGTGNIRDNCTDLGYYKYLDDSADKGTSGDKTISHSSLDAERNSIIGQNYPMYNWLASFSYVLKESDVPEDEPETEPVNTTPVLIETISGKYVQKSTLIDKDNSAFRIEKYSVAPNSYVNITGFMATDATCAWVKADGTRVEVDGLERGSGSDNNLIVQVPEDAVYIELSIHKTYNTTAIARVTAPVLVETIADKYVNKVTCEWKDASGHRIEKYAVTPGTYVNIKGFLASAATCAWVMADGTKVDVEAPADITFEHGGSSNNDITVQVPEGVVYIEVSMHKSYTTALTGVTAPVLVETIADKYVNKVTCEWKDASGHRIEKYAVTPGTYVNIKGFLASAATCAWVMADGTKVDVEAPADITFEHGGSSNNDITVQVPEGAVYIEVSMHKSYTTTLTGVDNGNS